MGRDALPRKQQQCEACGQLAPSYDIINSGSLELGYRQICGRCFNEEAAKSDRLDGFEHVDLEPIRLSDCTGEVHEFHFRSRLFGPGIALDAFELSDGDPAGYQFQIIGDPNDDPLVLLGRLIEKMRRALSVKHVVEGAHGLQIADHQDVRGRIGSNGIVPAMAKSRS